MGFSFCLNKVLVLAKDLATVNKKCDLLSESKFSQDERMNKFEQKQTSMESKVTELDKNVDGIMIHLGSIKMGMDRLEKISSKIFDMLDKKQDKVVA